MALPEDFNKIYGSTATGGLTPIDDVNYAKGWEFVGSNPPTKNDFSYLQNLSDLKSQWLYSNKLQRTNPFGDIKSDGAAAVAEALANLGLGGASKRDVGTDAKQIPDMSSFSSLKSENGYQKLPGGIIIQWGQSGQSAGQTGLASGTFPIQFPNECFFVALTETTSPSGSTPYSGVNCWGLGSLNRSGFVAVCASRLNNAAAVAESVRYIAIGF